MRSFVSLILAGAVLAVAGPATAQPAPGVAIDQPRTQAVAPANPAERRQAMFARLDTNRDGMISQAEFSAAADRMGQRRGAFAQRRGAMRQGLRGPDAPVGANRDRTVTRDEFAAMMMKRFDRLDADHDGKITPDERRARMRGMRGAGPNTPGAAG